MLRHKGLRVPCSSCRLAGVGGDLLIASFPLLGRVSSLTLLASHDLVGIIVDFLHLLAHWELLAPRSGGTHLLSRNIWVVPGTYPAWWYYQRIWWNININCILLEALLSCALSWLSPPYRDAVSPFKDLFTQREGGGVGFISSLLLACSWGLVLMACHPRWGLAITSWRDTITVTCRFCFLTLCWD